MPNLILKIHKTADELPERSGHYLCANMDIHIGGRPYWMHIPYSAEHKMFNTLDDMTSEKARGTRIDAHYWMELPETVEGWEGVGDE